MFNYYTWVYKQLIGIGLFLLMCAHMRYERERGQLRWEKWKSGERKISLVGYWLNHANWKSSENLLF